jgi:hypothetical protein
VSIQKPLIQQLADRHTSSLELDPAAVAASFGIVFPVNEPLPTTPFPIPHAEDDRRSEVLLDTLSPPRPAPAAPILEIVMRRLRSLTPRTEERKEHVANAIAALTVPLQALDQLIEEIEEDHFTAISTRWERCRKRGRELIDEIIPKLGKEVYQWQQASQKSYEAKRHRAADAEEYSVQRRKISDWASQREILDADKRLRDAAAASVEAAALALEDMRSLAVVESALANAQATLATLKTELHRLQAELKGTPYFDPELGLSRDPMAHRAQW